ncbi:MAG: GNAT family N-acetyltransferase [Luteitalea sp.]|nr:GNAT family N-acetyltransferase [Luteitalea sp.]
MEIRALNEGDDRSLFHSGDPDLVKFFHRFAGQNQGLGARLLRFVLELALRMASDYGCVGVVVDAKPGASDFYTKYGFIPVDVVEGQSDVRPQPLPLFLAIRSIAGALVQKRHESPA